MTLNAVDKAFHETYTQLLNEGHLKHNRTGVDTLMLPAMMMRFDLRGGKNPWPSTKELRDKKLREEMEWFISGESSIKFLRDNKNSIWDDWFIPGTDKYDAPVVRTLSVQERVVLASLKGLGETVARAVKGRLNSSGVGGSATLTVPLDARESVTFNGLASHCDLPAIGSWLDTHDIPREVTLWPAVDQDNKLTIDERMGIAIELGLLDNTTPLNPEHYPQEVLLDLLGIRERRDIPKPVSFKKRLSRVSKNRSEEWSRIRWAIEDNATDDGGGVAVEVPIWGGGKFVNIGLNSVQVDAVNGVMDVHNVPAWPLLDADIGPGGYGPQWRRWQDTQLINSADVTAYKKQGYQVVTRINDSEEFYDKVVVHREIDQLQNCITALRNTPDDRRILVTAWNPGLIWRAALPPCHLYFQFMTHHRKGQDVYNDLFAKDEAWFDFTATYSEDEHIHLTEATFVDWFDNQPEFRIYVERHLNNDDYRIPVRELHCLLVMRSSDTPLGTPFNVAQYALLVHVMAKITNMEAASLTWVGGDSHIYVNQIDAIKEQLSRDSMEDCDVRIKFERDIREINEFTFDSVSFSGYTNRGFLDIPVAV